jgi:hypothetical protein
MSYSILQDISTIREHLSHGGAKPKPRAIGTIAEGLCLQRWELTVTWLCPTEYSVGYKHEQ